jgi:hypothetical protein
MVNGGDGGEDYGVVLAISTPGYVLKDLTAEEREAERESRAGQKDARARAMYEAALDGATWQEIADAHGYETASGAYSAAHKYATRHGFVFGYGRLVLTDEPEVALMLGASAGAAVRGCAGANVTQRSLRLAPRFAPGFACLLASLLDAALRSGRS